MYVTVSLKIDLEVTASLTDPATSPAWVQVGLDGGWVPSREQAGGMEGKLGVVASHLEPSGKRGRHRLSQRRYVATCGVALVITVRMKKRGMRWKRDNATAVVALRVESINTAWAATA